MRERYRDTGRARAAGREGARSPARSALTEAVARYLFKLMAYKDEYEVARLYTDGSFASRSTPTFEGDNLRFEFHLAPPLLAPQGQDDGRCRARSPSDRG